MKLTKLKVSEKIREAVISQLIEDANSAKLFERYELKKDSIRVSAENLSCVKEDWVIVLSESVKKLILLLEKPSIEILKNRELLNIAYAALLYFEEDDDIIPDYNLLFRGLRDDAVAISYVITKIQKEYPDLAEKYKFSGELIQVAE